MCTANTSKLSVKYRKCYILRRKKARPKKTRGDNLENH